jgi:hypothetical protein
VLVRQEQEPNAEGRDRDGAEADEAKGPAFHTVVDLPRLEYENEARIETEIYYYCNLAALFCEVGAGLTDYCGSTTGDQGTGPSRAGRTVFYEPCLLVMCAISVLLARW